MLSRAVSPIWMDSSTGDECRAIARRSAVCATGAARDRGRSSGSPGLRSEVRDPRARAYAATDRIHLVSSFLASLLAGRHAPIDPGDGSGMNLMDLASATWWDDAMTATAPGLRAKLPALAPGSSIVSRWRATGRSATPSCGEHCRLVRRQPVQPDWNRARARKPARRLARHERHGLRADARAARGHHRHRPRVRRADRRLHGADLLQERPLARERCAA